MKLIEISKLDILQKHEKILTRQLRCLSVPVPEIEILKRARRVAKLNDLNKDDITYELEADLYGLVKEYFDVETRLTPNFVLQAFLNSDSLSFVQVKNVYPGMTYFDDDNVLHTFIDTGNISSSVSIIPEKFSNLEKAEIGLFIKFGFSLQDDRPLNNVASFTARFE